MFGMLKNLVTKGLGWAFQKGYSVAQVGLKPIQYFIDSHFRAKVTPVAGSVLYCDLWVAAEHSGIYNEEGEIVNIVVDGLAESTVRLSSPASFTSKSTVGKKIYVSCNKHGAVGNWQVAEGANQHVGEKAFYGLIIKNCHQFSSKCVHYAQVEPSLFQKIINWTCSAFGDAGWEPTFRQLKADARAQLGATKWLLWDWDNQAQHAPEPDWEAQNDFFQSQALNADFVDFLRQQLAETQAYEAEIADESIPKEIMEKLAHFRQTLTEVSDTYDKAKHFLATCPDAQLSFKDIQACGADFSQLADMMQNNQQIKLLVHKMGRNYLSEEKKKQCKIPKADKSEVHGIHNSHDLMRMLPAELVNLDDETLETLFYARLLESQLLCYELKGAHYINGETNETQRQRTGPVVACLDTSGSMEGKPLLKAKALLFAIANILKREKRDLHVLLFGAQGQIKEFALNHASELAGLMHFLQQSFAGGTDFKTPLQRALDIIAQQKDYKKADVLMISDGDCSLSNEFISHFNQEKQRLNCMAYSVLCAGSRVEDHFSDEVMVL